MGDVKVLSVSGDPRRPQEVRKYERTGVSAEGEPDAMMLFGMIMGILGLLFKYRILSWASLMMCLSAYATAKTETMDVKQLISSVTFSLMGLVTGYFAPSSKTAAAAAAKAASST